MKDRLAEDIDQLDPWMTAIISEENPTLKNGSIRCMIKLRETEEHLIEARAKKQAIDADRITRDNILSILMNFEKLFTAL